MLHRCKGQLDPGASPSWLDLQKSLSSCWCLASQDGESRKNNEEEAFPSRTSSCIVEYSRLFQSCHLDPTSSGPSSQAHRPDAAAVHATSRDHCHTTLSLRAISSQEYVSTWSKLIPLFSLSFLQTNLAVS